LIKLLIHGGAGAIRRENHSEEEMDEYKKALSLSLEQGFRTLSEGRSAEEAVVEAVKVLEDCPLFNSGKGSVLCSDGRVQMDASIMCGQNSDCGAVTLVEQIKNPILMARYVMRHTPHRILGSKDADALARELGFEMESQDYFVTEKSKFHLIEAKKKGLIQLDHDEGDSSQTVGAVALDQNGNLAAATSTGGLTNKFPGRVSDSSIPGAGTFANNKTLAFSATGTGDIFIQNMSGFDAHSQMLYGKASLSEACQSVLEKVKSKGGRGGVLGLTSSGQSFMGFNSLGMFRGMKGSDGSFQIEVF